MDKNTTQILTKTIEVIGNLVSSWLNNSPTNNGRDDK